MNMQLATTIGNTWRQVRRRYLVAACGLVLALGLVTGVSTWQAIEHSGGAGKGPLAQEPSSISDQQFLDSPAQPSFTYFLVGSKEHALALYGAEYSSSPIREWEAIVVASDEEANLFLQGIAEENNIRASSGLPYIQVEDLRKIPPSQELSSISDQLFPSTSVEPGITYFLVSSKEHAAAIYELIGTSFPFSPMEVIVVGSDEEANLFLQGIAEENNIRASSGLPYIQVEDLR